MLTVYDLLIVGGGISAATLCACLKQTMRICVLDTRRHIGGNCYDYRSHGTYVHQYGPHIFHSSSRYVVEFLSKYTEWIPYHHSVAAEVEDNDVLKLVPFPYCKLSSQILGRSLDEAEVLDMFFREYSLKMWGLEWDALPQVIKGRVPKDTRDYPMYYPNQFVAMPKLGYSRMIENMFDGVELVLGTGAEEWTQILARRVIYCGRPDRISVPSQRISYGELHDLELDFRSLEITFRPEKWPHQAAIINFCTSLRKHTRKTSYAKLTGGDSECVSYELPVAATVDDLAPYYPIPLDRNIRRYAKLRDLVLADYPNLRFCGRLGTYKYLDMYQAVGQALALAKEFLGWKSTLLERPDHFEELWTQHLLRPTQFPPNLAYDERS